MAKQLLPPEILDLVENEDWTGLAKSRFRWPSPETAAPEVADLLLELPKKERVLFFRALPKEVAYEAFAMLDKEAGDHLLLTLTDHETRDLLEELSPDDRTYVLDELPGQITQRLLNLLPPEDLQEARSLLGYPEDSAGRLMTTDYVMVREDWTVGRALNHIRRKGRDSEILDMIYVTDRNLKLVDALPLQKFILTEPGTPLKDIMDYSFVSITATEDRSEAVYLMQRYDRVILPVLDSQGILIGAVSVDDAMDVAEEETTEDFHRSAAVTPFRRSYWQAGTGFLIRSRIGWLSILILVNLLSSSVMAAYEAVLHGTVVLAVFIPLLIGTGGNTGSQSAALMVRAISIGDVELDQWGRAFLKELLIGVLLGLTLGILAFGLGLYRGGAQVGLVVFSTMAVMLVVTNLVGLLLPFVLTALKQDPAIASGPLITSVADVLGLIIYFSFASLILV